MRQRPQRTGAAYFQDTTNLVTAVAIRNTDANSRVTPHDPQSPHLSALTRPPTVAPLLSLINLSVLLSNDLL